MNEFNFDIYNSQLTELFKSIIVNKGLVKTGALRDSIKVIINQNLTIDIFAENYLSDLEKNNGIFKEFEIVSVNIITNAFNAYIEWQLQQQANQSEEAL